MVFNCIDYPCKFAIEKQFQIYQCFILNLKDTMKEEPGAKIMHNPTTLLLQTGF